MKEKLKNLDKKTIIYAAVAVAVVLLAILVVPAISKNGSGGLFSSSQTKVEKALVKMGDEFYQGFYYNLVTTGKTSTEIANMLRDKDITIAVAEMEKIHEIDIGAIKESIKSSAGKYDWEKTSVTIKPFAPFGVTDYTMAINLVPKED